jgi:hypothetical protein
MYRPAALSNLQTGRFVQYIDRPVFQCIPSRNYKECCVPCVCNTTACLTGSTPTASTLLPQIPLTIHLTLTTNIAINLLYLLLKPNPPNPLPKGLGHYVPVCHITKFYHQLFRIHAAMKMEQTQCSETSAIKHHTPENNPKDYTQHIS